MLTDNFQATATTIDLQANDQAHRTQVTFETQPTSFQRSGAATG